MEVKAELTPTKKIEEIQEEKKYDIFGKMSEFFFPKAKSEID